MKTGLKLYENSIFPSFAKHFDEFLELLEENPDKFWNQTNPMTKDNTVLGFRIKNENDVLSLSVDVPGCKPDDVEVNVQNHYLSIKGKRFDTGEEITRLIGISSEWDTSDVDATIEHGVLTVSFKRKPEKQNKTIKIKVK